MMSSSLGAQLNGILLKVKSRDYHEIYEIAFTYGLYEMTWEELYNTLNAKSSDGLITRHSFSEFFIEKGSRSSFGEDSYKKILGIFDCFDRTGSDFCDVDELTFIHGGTLKFMKEMQAGDGPNLQSVGAPYNVSASARFLRLLDRLTPLLQTAVVDARQ